jgi:hypothetical protein
MSRCRHWFLTISTAVALLLPNASLARDRLSFADVLARRHVTGTETEVAAFIAESRRAAAGSGGLAAEGASVAVTTGPRRTESDASTSDFAIELDVPLLTNRKARVELAREVEALTGHLLTGAGALAAAELAVTYVDAWLAQEAVAVREEDLAVTDELLALSRHRLEAGADPPYESVLVAGERDRALVDLVTARREAKLTWGELAARADVGSEQQALPLARPAGAWGPAEPFSRPVLAAIDARRRLEIALARARSGAAESRWALASAVAAEGDERLAHIGVAYRLAQGGERAAIASELAAAEARAERTAGAEATAARARIAAARESVNAAGPEVSPEDLERARRALAARVVEGKERPSAVLPLRRQLLESRLAALAAEALRARAIAELTFLTGDPPDAQ